MKRFVQLILLWLVCFVAQAQASQWDILLERDGQLFPSEIVSMASISRAVQLPSNYLGDPYGNIGITIYNDHANAKVRIAIRAMPFVEPTIEEYKLPVAFQSYEIFPNLRYNFERLKQNSYPTPARVDIAVSTGDEPFQEKSRNISVRSINECLLGFRYRSGQYQQTVIMFAAYVNENHQWIDLLLREALNAGVVRSFDGYQSGMRGVVQQVYAIWHTLQRRGFRYSNIVTTSQVSPNVQSQYVRLFDESIATSQANCVDGSVVLASILRRIGLRPILVLIPGHCFLGVHVDNNVNGQLMYLETTMMGNVNINRLPDQRNLDGQFAAFFGLQTKQQASYQSFLGANAEGNYKFAQNHVKLSRYLPGYALVDIAQARTTGFMPITR